jgi:kynurenine formamidase
MPAVDLTYRMTIDMPVYPGTPPPEIRPIARFQDSGFREQQLTFASHTGTHMDAPSHILDRGATLDELSVNQFFGTGLCIDVGMTIPGPIEWTMLQRFQKELADSDFLLLRTGWGQYWGSLRYFQGYPVLTTSASKRLSEFNLKGVGVDTLSVDTEDTADYPIHHTLLENHILIIENLANLDRLPEGLFGQLYCLPLHIGASDGAPTRVVAFF